MLRKTAVFVDMFIAAASFLIGFEFRGYLSDSMGMIHPLNEYVGLLPLFVFTWSGLLYWFKMYESFRTKPLWDIWLIVLRTAFVGFVFYSSVIYLFRLHEISRAFILLVFGIATVLTLASKIFLILFFRLIRRRGFNVKYLLVVGTNKRAQQFIQLIKEHSSWGYKLAGIIDDDPGKKGESVEGVKVLGTFKDMPLILRSMVIDEVVFVIPRSWLNKIEDILYLCEMEGLKIHVAVDYFEMQFSRAKVGELGKFPLLTFDSTPDKLWHLLIKRVFDFVFAGVLLVALSPFFLIVALLIKVTSAGPVFFRQKRVGLNGRIFTLYKFRTMIKDAEMKLNELRVHNEMTGPVFKMKNDPRVTWLGRILRKFSIDELPQLWNVFCGDMSTVGPRPPLPLEVKEYDAWHRRRLSMRPGITCLWQVSGRNQIVDFAKWVKLDLDYIDNWSLWLDAKIIAKTVPAVILGIGAK